MNALRCRMDTVFGCFLRAGLTVAFFAVGCGGRNGDAAAKTAGADMGVFSRFECGPKRDLSEEDEVVMATREAEFYGRDILFGVPVDYFELRNIGIRDPAVKSGVKCNKATDAFACGQNVDAIMQKITWPKTRGQKKVPIALTTKGDEVRVWRVEEFLELFGKIDTPTEAWIMMRNGGTVGMYYCEPYIYEEGGEALTEAYRKVHGGYEIREWHSRRKCPPGEIVESIHFIGENGEARILSERVVFKREQCPQ